MLFVLPGDIKTPNHVQETNIQNRENEKIHSAFFISDSYKYY